SRKLEKAIRENIVYMWLAGMQRPDHQTINRFRSERLREVIGAIFAQVVLLLHEEGLLDIKEVYTDGPRSKPMPTATPLFGARRLRETKNGSAPNSKNSGTMRAQWLQRS